MSPNKRTKYTGTHLNESLIVTLLAVMYKYLCKNLLLASLLLPLPALAHQQTQPNPCLQAGTVAISTDGPPPTVKFSICTGIPQHLRTYLSIQNYWFATTDAPLFVLTIVAPLLVAGSLICRMPQQKRLD